MNFESPSGCHYNTSTSKLLDAHEISWMSIRVYPYSWWMTSMLCRSLWLCQDQHPMFHAVPRWAKTWPRVRMATGRCEAMGSYGIHGIVSCHALSCHSPRFGKWCQPRYPRCLPILIIYCADLRGTLQSGASLLHFLHQIKAHSGPHPSPELKSEHVRTLNDLANSQRKYSCLRLRSGTLSTVLHILHCFCALFGANVTNTQQQTTWSVFRFHPQMLQDLTNPQLQPPAPRMSGAQISGAALGILQGNWENRSILSLPQHHTAADLPSQLGITSVHMARSSRSFQVLQVPGIFQGLFGRVTLTKHHHWGGGSLGHSQHVLQLLPAVASNTSTSSAEAAQVHEVRRRILLCWLFSGAGRKWSKNATIRGTTEGETKNMPMPSIWKNNSLRSKVISEPSNLSSRSWHLWQPMPAGLQITSPGGVVQQVKTHQAQLLLLEAFPPSRAAKPGGVTKFKSMSWAGPSWAQRKWIQ